MRAVINALNSSLSEANLKLPEEAEPHSAALSLAVIHHDTLFVAQSGLSQVLLLQDGNSRLFFDPDLDPRGIAGVLDRVFVRGWAWLVLQIKTVVGWFDKQFIDRILVHAGPFAIYVLGGVLQMAQTGSVHFYALVTAMGALVLIASALFAEGILNIILALVVMVALAGVVGASLFRRQRKAVRP